MARTANSILSACSDRASLTAHLFWPKCESLMKGGVLLESAAKPKNPKQVRWVALLRTYTYLRFSRSKGAEPSSCSISSQSEISCGFLRDTTLSTDSIGTLAALVSDYSFL
jgi:hypothetical protein